MACWSKSALRLEADTRTRTPQVCLYVTRILSRGSDRVSAPDHDEDSSSSTNKESSQTMAEVAVPTHNFDLVLLGGGTGGYVAAVPAQQLGLTVAVVEELILGGCCLHRGCIPTKAFLKSADMFDDVKRAAEFGIDIKGEIS